MATTHHKKKRPGFPRPLGRFTSLGGGLYGALDLVAITDDELELQTGEDFIRFNRAQATALRNLVDKFLSFDKDDKDDDDKDDDAVEDAEVDVAEVVVVEEESRAPRRPRRKSA
jgi:hypothetical protein